MMKSMPFLLILLLTITGYTIADTLTLTPMELSFTWIVGESTTQPTSSVIFIMDNGGEESGWELQSIGGQWATAFPINGEFFGGTSQTHISINTHLAPTQPGNHQWSLEFQFENSIGAPTQLFVNLLVVAPTPCTDRYNCSSCLAEPGCGYCYDNSACVNSSSNCNFYFPTSCPVSCFDPNCSTHGTCNPYSGTCDCFMDYFGNSCDIFCTTANCSSNGNCSQSTSGVFCNCESNYYADDCSVFCLASTNCSGRGMCDFFNNGTCKCDYPAYGDSCQFTACPQNCNGNGLCNNVTGVCSCDQDYYGTGCSTFCSANTTCSAHGSCTSSGVCTCNTTYYGNSCEVFCDNTTTCSSTGYCSSSGECICNSGYYTSNCGVFCASNITCSSNGVCFQNGTCNCMAPYFGDTCMLKNCEGYAQNNTCNSHGICNTTTSLCSCETNYNCKLNSNQPVDVTITCNFCQVPKSFWMKYHIYIFTAGGIIAVLLIGLVIIFLKRRKSGYQTINS